MSEAGANFRATVRQLPDVAVLDLFGELDGFSEQALAGAYAQATAGETAPDATPAAVLLNFNGVDYMNSTGIALIVGLLTQARQDKRRFLVCCLSEHYQEIFRITRLEEYMTVVVDEESALRAIGELTS